MASRLVLAAAMALPLAARAHGFDERHELPAPLALFMTGAALAVALSFLLALVFARRAPTIADGDRAAAPSIHLPRSPRIALRLLALAIFCVTVAAALAGTADPMMNLAPTLVWIGWWVGLSLVVACIADLWPLLDPWATLFDGLDATARRFGRCAGISPGWQWPPALGAWPAVLLLLLWSWLEVVYPLAAVPWRIGCAALAWTAITLLGMVCFGRAGWQRHGDFFAIYFALLGRMAPIGWCADANRFVLRVPGSALVAPPADDAALPPGGVAFVLAMLSTVLFDGLHASAAWPVFEGVLARLGWQVLVSDGNLSGAIGLVLLWLAFLAAYGFTAWATARCAGGASASSIARSFAPTLVPIAVGYALAHNFSRLATQGQNLLSLVSDPLGRHWDLFGTAQLHTRSDLVDARLTWHVAIGTIVLGHCIGVWLAHRVALREFGGPRQAVRAALPLVLLMLAYTALSLYVIAEPMVQYHAQ